MWNIREKGRKRVQIFEPWRSNNLSDGVDLTQPAGADLAHLDGRGFEIHDLSFAELAVFTCFQHIHTARFQIRAKLLYTK